MGTPETRLASEGGQYRAVVVKQLELSQSQHSHHTIGCANHCQTMSQYLMVTQTLVALACPAYSSLQALLTVNLTRQSSWLRYWMVYATVELCSLPLLYYQPPTYTMTALITAKLLLLVWCQAPIKENGSDVIFSQVAFLNEEFSKASCSFMEDSEFEEGEKITIKYSFQRKLRLLWLRIKMKFYDMIDPS